MEVFVLGVDPGMHSTVVESARLTREYDCCILPGIG